MFWKLPGGFAKNGAFCTTPIPNKNESVLCYLVIKMLLCSSPFYEAAQPPPDKQPAVVSTVWHWQWTPAVPQLVWHCCSSELPIQPPSAWWQSDYGDKKNSNICDRKTDQLYVKVGIGDMNKVSLYLILGTLLKGMMCIRIFANNLAPLKPKAVGNV